MSFTDPNDQCLRLFGGQFDGPLDGESQFDLENKDDYEQCQQGQGQGQEDSMNSYQPFVFNNTLFASAPEAKIALFRPSTSDEQVPADSLRSPVVRSYPDHFTSAWPTIESPTQSTPYGHSATAVGYQHSFPTTSPYSVDFQCPLMHFFSSTNDINGHALYQSSLNESSMVGEPAYNIPLSRIQTSSSYTSGDEQPQDSTYRHRTTQLYIPNPNEVDLSSPTTATKQDPCDKKSYDSYAVCICRILLQAPRYTLPLKKIYDKVGEEKFGDHLPSTQGWTNSVRHNLSMNGVSGCSTHAPMHI
jgi:hypothetical protein